MTQSNPETEIPETATPQAAFNLASLTARFAKLKQKADKNVHGVVEVALELKEMEGLWKSLPQEERPSKPLSYWVRAHLSPKGLAWFTDLADAATAIDKPRWTMLHPDAIRWVHTQVDLDLRVRYFDDEVSRIFSGLNKQTPLSKTQAQSAYTRLLKALVKVAH